MMYQSFVDAWHGGDPLVQPAVRRAEEATAALRGEVVEPLETP